VRFLATRRACCQHQLSFLFDILVGASYSSFFSSPTAVAEFQYPYLRRNGLTYSGEIWHGKTWGRCVVFLAGHQPRSIPRRRAPASPKNFAPPTYPNGLTYSDEIWHDNTWAYGVSLAPIPRRCGPI